VLPIVIEGEAWEPVTDGSHSLAYDLYVEAEIEAAALPALLAAAHDKDETERRTLAQQALRQVAETGNGHRFLSAWYQPRGEKWTPQWAAGAAERINRNKDPGIARVLTASVLEGLGDFFGVGPRFSKISRSCFAAHDLRY
jgi:hypothetical protein